MFLHSVCISYTFPILYPLAFSRDSVHSGFLLYAPSDPSLSLSLCKLCDAFVMSRWGLEGMKWDQGWKDKALDGESEREGNLLGEERTESKRQEN